jgi:hypothetical protein
MRLRRQNEPAEVRQHRIVEQRSRQVELRSIETLDDRNGRIEEQRIRQAELRLNETLDDRNARIEEQRIRQAELYLNETLDDHSFRLQEQRLRQAELRKNETTDSHISRLQKKNDHRRKRNKVVYDNGEYKFFENFEKETKDCNAFYRHENFPNSHNHNNWTKAKESEMFGFQRMKGYQSLELFWNKKCGECHAMYLDGESPAFMKKCCGSFKAHGLECEPYGLKDLPPLLPSIKQAIEDHPEHMSKFSQTYNNLLSFGATGVENKRGGGWEKDFRGPHAATINGRTYHKTHDQSSSNPSSGLGYIFFDNLQKLNENSEKFDELKQEILQSVYEEMKVDNAIAQEVHILGKNLYVVVSPTVVVVV